jgi:hypothetical protein
MRISIAHPAIPNGQALTPPGGFVEDWSYARTPKLLQLRLHYPEKIAGCGSVLLCPVALTRQDCTARLTVRAENVNSVRYRTGLDPFSGG